MHILALLSDHRAHKSASPRMHNAVIKGLGLETEYTYIALEIAPTDLAQAMAGFRALNLAGANVTIPYKEQVGQYLDAISDNARAAGAVNTIIRRGDKLIGDNSDIGGYLDALKLNHLDPAGKDVCIVGNGGAARGLIIGLKQAGARSITIAGRNLTRAQTLASEFAVESTTIDQINNLPREIAILTNATAVSTPAESPELSEIVSCLKLPALECIVDINYGRENSFWECYAARAGVKFIDGLPMLALQARISFEAWTGIEVTQSAYLRALGVELSDA